MGTDVPIGGKSWCFEHVGPKAWRVGYIRGGNHEIKQRSRDDDPLSCLLFSIQKKIYHYYKEAIVPAPKTYVAIEKKQTLPTTESTPLS